MYSRCCIQIHSPIFTQHTLHNTIISNAQERESTRNLWWRRNAQVCVWKLSLGLDMCNYDNLLLRQSHPLAGWNHVLVSDKVSNITSLSYISHSRVKESRRGVSNIILSWFDSGVSKDVMLVSSNLGVARRSPGSDVFSIFISAGVFKLPRTLSLRSVP